MFLHLRHTLNHGWVPRSPLEPDFRQQDAQPTYHARYHISPTSEHDVQQHDEEVQGSEGPQKGAEGEDSIQAGTGFRALAVAVAPYISDIESDTSPVMNVAIGDEDAQTTVA
jgi:hypothetical protein